MRGHRATEVSRPLTLPNARCTSPSVIRKRRRLGEDQDPTRQKDQPEADGECPNDASANGWAHSNPLLLRALPPGFDLEPVRRATCTIRESYGGRGGI